MRKFVIGCMHVSVYPCAADDNNLFSKLVFPFCLLLSFTDSGVNHCEGHDLKRSQYPITELVEQGWRYVSVRGCGRGYRREGGCVGCIPILIGTDPLVVLIRKDS